MNINARQTFCKSHTINAPTFFNAVNEKLWKVYKVIESQILYQDVEKRDGKDKKCFPHLDKICLAIML